MRHFSSYGPVDPQEHFCVEREHLVEHCMNQLMGKTTGKLTGNPTGQEIGTPEKGGHYFTIWAPRQTGKTWLMHQVAGAIDNSRPDTFIIGKMSVQRVILREGDSDEEFFIQLTDIVKLCFGIDIPNIEKWNDWTNLFVKGRYFKRPVILFIDEFDKLPRSIIDHMVTLFREMYLNRKDYCLHGLALIGVRAVLGLDSLRGSPFNVQRSLHIPNFTLEEVKELFRQYQIESGQGVTDEVVQAVFDTTWGQPGLVCWFGELLTEKYNTAPDSPIDFPLWEEVLGAALYVEWNNSVLNLVKKAKTPYLKEVLELFSSSDIPFALDSDWCGHLYFNGIISHEKQPGPPGPQSYLCRFSSPFVQHKLFNALSREWSLSREWFADRTSITPLQPLDDLGDVFAGENIDVPALVDRYVDFLGRLAQKGIHPFHGQPRRGNMNITEAVGHFHLYAWLLNVVGRRCVVSPEFPTGNGKVDIHLKCQGKKGLIEVKSFSDLHQLRKGVGQAAG
ncbi:MAG: AAA-like domain-containing protein, partial [Desulfamplus sp.]|nr:AAA-like domain-containing protein [Desulfamplus sp.]